MQRRTIIDKEVDESETVHRQKKKDGNNNNFSLISMICSQDTPCRQHSIVEHTTYMKNYPPVAFVLITKSHATSENLCSKEFAIAKYIPLVSISAKPNSSLFFRRHDTIIASFLLNPSNISCCYFLSNNS